MTLKEKIRGDCQSTSNTELYNTIDERDRHFAYSRLLARTRMTNKVLIVKMCITDILLGRN